MIILLSPSKSINFKDSAGIQRTDPQFLEQSETLVATANQLGSKLAETLGVSEAIAETNRQQFKDWKTQPTESESSPAAWAYRGETFAGLSIEQLSAEQLQFAQDHLLIVSGLYGLLRPQDQIMPYRLEMSTKLTGMWGKSMYDFWGAALADHITAQKPDFILNCASDEYFKAVKKHLPKELEVVTPKFLHQGKSKMAFAKYTRGLMARWAVENKIQTAADALNFDAEGYKLDDDASKPNLPVFNAPDSFSLKGRWVKTRAKN